LSQDTLKYQIAISKIPGIGVITAKKLIAYVGSAEGVFKEKNGLLKTIPGMQSSVIKEIRNKEVLKVAEKELEFIDEHNIRTLYYLDKGYPERLKHCEDSPLLLYLKGDTDLNRQKILSIVGTRNATVRGRDLCTKLVSDLAEHKHDVLIVSGLAYGIDFTAHKAALDNGLDTVAVLGHGLDIIYPAHHKEIAREIVSQGALMTEFTSHSYREKAHFVMRNRIIAGISDATVVVESGNKGGSLITADIANSYNRDVFAFPGRIADEYSIGCNRLIKTNRAALIESVSDLEYILGWDVKKMKEGVQKQLFAELNNEEKIIADLLKKENELSIDIISLRTNMPVSKASSILLGLEFKGLIKSLPGKIYAI